MNPCLHFPLAPKAVAAGCECGALWTPTKGWYMEENSRIPDDEVEQLFLAKIKVIGDNEQTYVGYPDELIADVRALIARSTRQAVVEALEELKQSVLQYPKQAIPGLFDAAIVRAKAGEL